MNQLWWDAKLKLNQLQYMLVAALISPAYCCVLDIKVGMKYLPTKMRTVALALILYSAAVKGHLAHIVLHRFIL